MFDPHRVGLSSSSYYDRNKGRVLQRKVVDMPGQPITRSQLLSNLPIMRLNGIVQTPIVRQFVSQNSTFTFDSDTYLATGSTVTFSGSTGVHNINQIIIIPSQGSSTDLSLSDFEYTETANQITIHSNEGGGSIVFIYIKYISYIFTSSNYIFHTDAGSDSADSGQTSTFSVPANSIYIVLRNREYPLTFQLIDSSGTGVMAYYSPDAGADAFGVMNSEFFYFDDDRLATN